MSAGRTDNMALSQDILEAFQETITGLQTHLRAGNVIAKPVLVTPRRMRQLILYTQAQMNVNIDGQIIMLKEDDNAPQDFVQAMTQAAPDPEPALSPDEQRELDELTEFRKFKAMKAREAALAAMGGESSGTGNAR